MGKLGSRYPLYHASEACRRRHGASLQSHGEDRCGGRCILPLNDPPFYWSPIPDFNFVVETLAILPPARSACKCVALDRRSYGNEDNRRRVRYLRPVSAACVTGRRI